MKKFVKLSIFAIAITLGLMSCAKQEPKSSEATSQGTTESTTQTYACPMKCEGDKTYASAGKCPKCGMDIEAIAGH